MTWRDTPDGAKIRASVRALRAYTRADSYRMRRARAGQMLIGGAEAMKVTINAVLEEIGDAAREIEQAPNDRNEAIVDIGASYALEASYILAGEGATQHFPEDQRRAVARRVLIDAAAHLVAVLAEMDRAAEAAADKAGLP